MKVCLLNSKTKTEKNFIKAVGLLGLFLYFYAIVDFVTRRIKPVAVIGDNAYSSIVINALRDEKIFHLAPLIQRKISYQTTAGKSYFLEGEGPIEDYQEKIKEEIYQVPLTENEINHLSLTLDIPKNIILLEQEKFFSNLKTLKSKEEDNWALFSKDFRSRNFFFSDLYVTPASSFNPHITKLTWQHRLCIKSVTNHIQNKKFFSYSAYDLNSSNPSIYHVDSSAKNKRVKFQLYPKDLSHHRDFKQDRHTEGVINESFDNNINTENHMSSCEENSTETSQSQWYAIYDGSEFICLVKKIFICIVDPLESGENVIGQWIHRESFVENGFHFCSGKIEGHPISILHESNNIWIRGHVDFLYTPHNEKSKLNERNHYKGKMGLVEDEKALKTVKSLIDFFEVPTKNLEVIIHPDFFQISPSRPIKIRQGIYNIHPWHLPHTHQIWVMIELVSRILYKYG